MIDFSLTHPLELSNRFRLLVCALVFGLAASASADFDFEVYDDMFCAGVATLENGLIVAAGGNGVHAYSEISVRLDGIFDRFLSDIGLDDERDGLCGDVRFEVDLD